jgi:hypothetical protein
VVDYKFDSVEILSSKYRQIKHDLRTNHAVPGPSIAEGLYDAEEENYAGKKFVCFTAKNPKISDGGGSGGAGGGTKKPKKKRAVVSGGAGGVASSSGNGRRKKNVSKKIINVDDDDDSD